MERLFKTPAPSRARSWRRQKVAWLKRRIWEINELCPKPQVLSWHGHTFIPGCVPFDTTVQLHWIRDVHDVNIWNCGKSIGLESARVIRKNSLWKCCAHCVSLLLWLLVPCRCPAPAFVQRFVPITCSDIGRLPRNYAQTGMVMQSPTSWVLLYYNTWTPVCIVPSPQYWFGGPYWFGIRGLRQFHWFIPWSPDPNGWLSIADLDVLHFLCHVVRTLGIFSQVTCILLKSHRSSDFPGQLPYICFQARMPLSW